MLDAQNLVSASTLGQLHSLQVAARTIVEGLRAGSHRSPLKGHSVDFADHRPYVPGDDIRHLDWKVMARRDRLVLKRYEAEVDLTCTLAVDGSGSMAYRGSRASVSKWRYASVLTACLTYLVVKQQDRASLVIYTDSQAQALKPGIGQQLDRTCATLEAHQPSGQTDAGTGLQQLAAAALPRGLVILITDGLDEFDRMVGSVDRLRHRGHDVALVWLLDPDELDLGVPALARFQGLEADGEIVAEPRALRAAYEKIVEEFRIDLEEACRGRGVAMIPANTGEAPHLPLNRLLVALQRRG